MSRSNTSRRVRNKERKDGRGNTSSFFKRDKNNFTNNVVNITESVYKSRKIETTELIKPKTYNQQRYFDSIKRNTITIGAGMAGSGKTLIPAFLGVQFLNNDKSPIEKIVYIRANVDSQYEDDLGALPGEMNEKISPLVRPLLRSFMKFMPEHTAKYLCNEDNGKVVATTLRALEGETFENCFVISDEAEFYQAGAIKLLLTRLGLNSKWVLTGDDSQACGKNTGIIERVIRCWNGKLNDFDYVKFDYEDCQRNSIITPALRLLDNL